MVASRWPHSLPLPATFISRSTSSPVRYSRGRTAALATRRGGVVPFTMLGTSFLFTRKLLFLIGVAYQVVPLIATNGLSHKRWLDLPGGRPFRAGWSHDLARGAGPERSVRSARYPGSTSVPID